MTDALPIDQFGTTLEAALCYAEYGWYVLPIRAGGKRPAISDWPNNASVDVAVIRSWWEWLTENGTKPEPSVGIMTGIKSGIVVVDVDPRNGGDQYIDAYLAETKLQVCAQVRTGSGGSHYYFKHPGRISNDPAHQFIRSRTGRDTGPRPGLELKADGGHMIVAPPSLHVSGNRYEWLPLAIAGVPA